MKKLLIIIATILTLSGCDNGKYVVTGDLKGASGAIMLIDRNGETIATTESGENGSFTLTGDIDNPQVAFLQCDAISFMKMIFIGDGKTKITSMDDGAIISSGTKLNDQLELLNAEISRFGMSNGSDEEYKAILTKFFDKNAKNALGELLFINMSEILSSEEMNEAYGKLSDKGRQDSYVKDVMARIEASKATAVGQPYINMAQVNDKGEKVILADVLKENKYVLLDFWASWCGPCMEEAPYLVEAYGKYHDRGFEIYGISLDQERENWVNAFTEKNMTWIQTSMLEGWNNPSVTDYSVDAIPANFLIDSNGTIVAKNLRKDAIEAKLAELFE